MRSARAGFTIMGISLVVIIGLIGCSKTTNTASQGIDVAPKQAKEVPPATENATANHPSMLNDAAINQNMVEPEKAVKDVFFDFNTPAIRSDMKPVIDIDAAVIKTKEAARIRVEGYCDERGTDEYNLALGNKRAYSVKQVLAAEGVDVHRITTISYGKEKPFCNDHNEACYKLNRRAHLVVE